MIAYSSVAQAGYMLAGVVVTTQLGISATVFYLAIYVVMNLAAFAVIVAREREAGIGDDISSLYGLGRDRPWLAWPMAAVVALSTVVRWWCVTVLGRHWNPRLIVIPEAPLVRRGPYRWMQHPNYTAVVAEVAALPLVHSAWLTAIVFSIANALVLSVRISRENAALGYA